MTKKQYYAAIEKYNQMIEERHTNTFFTTHTVDELFRLQNDIRNQVKKMLVFLAAQEEDQYRTLRKRFTRNQIFGGAVIDDYADMLREDEDLHALELAVCKLYSILYNLEDITKPILDYERTYISDLYSPYLFIGLAGLIILCLLRLIFS